MAKHQKECKQCGKAFVSSRSDAMFCSAICRTRYNKAMKEATIESMDQEASDVTRGEITKYQGGVQGKRGGRSSYINAREDVELKDLLSAILGELEVIRDSLTANDKILTIDQVCEMLDISRPTFERYQSEGLLKVHHIAKEGQGKKKGRGRKPYLLYSEVLGALRRKDQGED